MNQSPSLLQTLNQAKTMIFHNHSYYPTKDKSFARPWTLFWLIAAYWTILFFLGGLKTDHLLLCGLVLVLYYWRPGSRQFVYLVAPLVLSGILYDSMRYYADYIRGPVHVAQPYFLEKKLFGLHTGINGTLETPNEFWQKHTFRILDFFCGLAYIIFIFEYTGICIYFYFAKLWHHMRKAAWSFFVVNFMGYVTYYVYAAAPPWYVAQYGLGPARMDTPANPAGTVRFDALFGTHFFTGMYGKAADVFGAIPSLHVSYPFMAVVFAFQIKRFRIPALLFFILMCFSAVYLNHHYVIDVLLGVSYAIVTLILIENFYKNKVIDPNRIY